MSDELLSQEQARQLRMLCHACIDRLGGTGMPIDEDDNPSSCRLARVGDCLVIADFATDPNKSRFRQIDLFMVEAGGQVFKLDPRHRLASFKATHFALPADYELQLDRPPALWFGPVTLLMLEALQPVIAA